MRTHHSSALALSLCSLFAAQPALLHAANPKESLEPSARLAFSRFPRDEEIMRARVLPGPILPVTHTVGQPAAPVENSDLAQALLEYAKPANAGNLMPLTQFLVQHPDSRWRAGLLVNLGAAWRSTGHFPKAMEAFEESWNLTRNSRDAIDSQIANWAVGELAAMHGHLGHTQRLNALMAEIGDRDLHGPATEQVAGAREAIWFLHHHPEDSYRCGPLSLLKIREYLH